MVFDKTAIGLSGAGVSDMAEAAVRVICMNNAVNVSATGLVEVSLERDGRKKTLEGTQAIALLPEDVLCFGEHRIEIVKIWQYAKPGAEQKRRHFPSLKKLFGAAAAFVMAAVPSCQPRGMGDVPDPNYNPDEEVKAPVVEVEEMGEPPEPEPVSGNAEPEANDSAEAGKPELIEPPNINMRTMGDVYQKEPDDSDKENTAAAPEGAGFRGMPIGATQDAANTGDADKKVEDKAPKEDAKLNEKKKQVVEPRRLAGKPPARGAKKGGK